MTRKLHPEEEKLIANLKRDRPGWTIAEKPLADASNTDIDANDLVIVTIDAGNEDHARECALLCNKAVQRKPSVRFVFGVNGLIDDPREVDEIPAGRTVLRSLLSNMTQEAFHRFGMEQQAMMLVAAGIGQRLPGGKMMVPPWMVREPK